MEEKVYTYEEARKIVEKAGIKTQREYKSHCREYGLTTHPERYYKDKGWINWNVFFGKKKIEYPSYEKAREIVEKAGIKTSKDYDSLYKEYRLPSTPADFYKDNWINWGVFLGGKEKESHSYEEAKEIVKKAGVKTSREYWSLCKEYGLPTHPEKHYKDKGWTNWPDFLGKSTKSVLEEKEAIALTTLYINPELLDDDPTLQVLYILASKLHKNLAKKIEKLLGTSSYEERLKWIKDQLKSIKGETATTPKTSIASSSGEVLSDEAESDNEALPDVLMERESTDDDEEDDELSPMETISDESESDDEALPDVLMERESSDDDEEDDELSPMETIIGEYKDFIDSLSEEDKREINTTLENYYHNAVNRELIKEYDG